MSNDNPFDNNNPFDDDNPFGGDDFELPSDNPFKVDGPFSADDLDSPSDNLGNTSKFDYSNVFDDDDLFGGDDFDLSDDTPFKRLTSSFASKKPLKKPSYYDDLDDEYDLLGEADLFDGISYEIDEDMLKFLDGDYRTSGITVDFGGWFKSDKGDFDFNDDFGGFDDNDFGFDDDSDFGVAPKQKRPQSQFPQKVEEYLIVALSGEVGLYKTLAQLMQISIRGNNSYQAERRKKELSQLVLDKWLAMGDYRGVISIALFMDTQNNDIWFDVTKVVMERDDIAKLQTAIAQHRSKQGGALLYFALILNLLEAQDPRAREIWHAFLEHLQSLNNTMTKGFLLSFVTVCLGLVDLPPQEAVIAQGMIERWGNDKGVLPISHAVQFAKTLFTSDDLNTVYRICDTFLAEINKLPPKRILKSAIIGDLDGSLAYMVLGTFIFRLRQRDLITPWINFYRRVGWDNEDVALIITQLKLQGFYLVHQPNEDKRLLFVHYHSDLQRLTPLLYAVLNNMITLLSGHLTPAFAHIPDELIDQISRLEDENTRAEWIAKFGGMLFIFPQAHLQAQATLDSLLASEDKQTAVEVLLTCASLLALHEHPQFEALLAQALRMWDMELEKQITIATGRRGNTDPAYIKTPVSTTVWRVPINELTRILKIFLTQGDAHRAEQFLTKLSPKVLWRVLYTILAENPLADITDKPDDWDEGYYRHMVRLNNTIVKTLAQVIPKLIPTLTDNVVNDELPHIVTFLHADGYAQEANALTQFITSDRIRAATIHKNQPTIDDGVLDEIREQHRVISKQANELAKKHDPKAKSTFDEAVRLARIAQTQAIPKPFGAILQQLITTIITHQTDITPIITQLRDMPSYHQRKRDKIGYAIVALLVNMGRLDEAKSICDWMQTDPWRIQAHAKLIEGLVIANQMTMAQQLLSQAEGKQNRFMVACAYALGLAHSHHADAQTALQSAELAISALPRPALRANAWNRYALGLLRIGHPSADEKLTHALTIIRATPDMTSRFYALYDMLEGLLAYHHRLWKTVLGYCYEVLAECENIVLPPIPSLGLLPHIERDMAEQARRTWRWVAINNPIWETSASLDLAQLLAKHGYMDDATQLVTQARDYQSQTRWNPWDISLDFIKITNPNTLKSTFDALESLPIHQVLELILTWDRVFDTLENGLSNKITQHMLRLYRWIGYEVGDLAYLMKG